MQPVRQQQQRPSTQTPMQRGAANAYEVARAFADAYAAADAVETARLLHPDVREREITPGAIVDQRGVEAVVAEMRGFVAAYGEPGVLLNEVEPFGPLFRWTVRWHLAAGLVEWHAFITVADGRVTALDAICSGVVSDDDRSR